MLHIQIQVFFLNLFKQFVLKPQKVHSVLLASDEILLLFFQTPGGGTAGVCPWRLQNDISWIIAHYECVLTWGDEMHWT